MVQQPLKSRRKPEKFTAQDGTEVKTVYCRYCMVSKKPTEFYPATDKFLDQNGFMSTCKGCIDEIYNKFYLTTNDIERAIYLVCKTINVAYIPRAVQATITYVNKPSDSRRKIESLFSYYKRMMSSLDKINPDNKMTFEPVQSKYLEKPMDGDSEENIELKKKWGKHFSFEDIEFLESQLADWTKDHGCDNKAEFVLLKEVCIAQLDNENDRLMGKTPDLKRLSDLMKLAGLDPAKANVAGAGKSHDTFSNFVKTIEEHEPADYYQDKKLFRDFDNLDFYFRKYVTRPLKNFITQSRDFNVEKEDDDENDDFDIGEVQEE